jgi:hypothetical protein
MIDVVIVFLKFLIAQLVAYDDKQQQAGCNAGRQSGYIND